MLQASNRMVVVNVQGKIQDIVWFTIQDELWRLNGCQYNKTAKYM
jgi:hypothetical protein